jgi:hypothetical protein
VAQEAKMGNAARARSIFMHAAIEVAPSP